jgi:hypothetical protein
MYTYTRTHTNTHTHTYIHTYTGGHHGDVIEMVQDGRRVVIATVVEACLAGDFTQETAED